MTPFPKTARMRKKMTNNPNAPHEELDAQELSDAVVELTGPDGTVYRFRYGAILPYAGQEYVVLVEMENDENDEEQLLITRLSDSPDGEMTFEVVTEEDIIQAVFQKYMQEKLSGSLGDEEDCCCGHDHGHEGGCCGGHGHDHNHEDGCCGGHNHEGGCCGGKH